jgi:hypothetical protein
MKTKLKPGPKKKIYHTPHKSPFKWDDTIYVKAHILAKEGLRGKRLSSALGMSFPTFKKLKKKNSAFADAINSARAGESTVKAETFLDYIYERLPPKVKSYWDKISRWEKEENGILKIEALLAEGGMLVRMHIFMHALVSNHFNVSLACKCANISLNTLDKWVKNYPEFTMLMKHVQTFKKDFFESALVKLVGEGDSPAVIFANKTYNRDRGYNDRQEVKIEQTIEQTHLVDIGVLNLPLEVKKVILDAWRKHKQAIEQERLAQDQTMLEYKRDGDKAIPVEEAEEAA